MEGNSNIKINRKVEGNSNFEIAISFHSSNFGKMGNKMEWNGMEGNSNTQIKYLNSWVVKLKNSY